MKALSIELKIILFTLAAHLFYSNSELLIAAKEMVTKDAPVSLFDKTVLTAFALSYSVMTTVAVFTLRRLIPVLVFAALDGFAVYLRINVEQPQFILISSLFYGFYTAYIIVIAYMLKTTPAAPAAATLPRQPHSPPQPLPPRSLLSPPPYLAANPHPPPLPPPPLPRSPRPVAPAPKSNFPRSPSPSPHLPNPQPPRPPAPPPPKFHQTPAPHSHN